MWWPAKEWPAGATCSSYQRVGPCESSANITFGFRLLPPARRYSQAFVVTQFRCWPLHIIRCKFVYFRGFDLPCPTCYKCPFCAEGCSRTSFAFPGSPSAPTESDAAKLSTPISCLAVEACSELRQCAYPAFSSRRSGDTACRPEAPKHVLIPRKLSYRRTPLCVPGWLLPRP